MLSAGAERGGWVGLRGPQQPSLYQHYPISSHQLIFTLACGLAPIPPSPPCSEEGGGGSWWILGCPSLFPPQPPPPPGSTSWKPGEEACEPNGAQRCAALELHAGQRSKLWNPGSRWLASLWCRDAGRRTWAAGGSLQFPKPSLTQSTGLLPAASRWAGQGRDY